jgi:hypothetical protein
MLTSKQNTFEIEKIDASWNSIVATRQRSADYQALKKVTTHEHGTTMTEVEDGRAI